LQHISPFLEPTAAGITSLWARTAALKYNCFVTVGYPEKVDVTPKWPAGPEFYNSSVTVNRDGETVLNYRKSFLYYTDETWALEGSGFFGGEIPDLGNVAMGICESKLFTWQMQKQKGKWLMGCSLYRTRHGFEVGSHDRHLFVEINIPY